MIDLLDKMFWWNAALAGTYGERNDPREYRSRKRKRRRVLNWRKIVHQEILLSLFQEILLGVIVMTFWYVFGTDLTFFELFKLYFHLGLIMTPHVLYDHMTYVYSFSHMFSFFTRVYGQEKSLSYYDLLLTLEFYSMDASLPSFSSSSSTKPPPLYSLSMSINNGPTWRRIPPGLEVWLSGKARLYLGGLSSLQTRHCQGRTGPSIREVSTAGWTRLSGTLTGLGKVWPPIVVNVRVFVLYPINPGRLSNQCRTGADRCTPKLQGCRWNSRASDPEAYL